jgi:fatty acid desaturase
MLMGYLIVTKTNDRDVSINITNIKKPVLDPSLYKLSLIWTMVNICYGVSMFILFAYLNYFVMNSDLPVAAQIILVIPFTFFSAIGLYVLAALGHEGMHGNLFKSEGLSLATGLFFSSSVLTYMDMGFVVRHWDHHRYTNQALDPDIHPTAHLTNWWQRLFYSRIIFNIIYIKYTFNMAIGRVDYVSQYKTPLSPSQLVFYSRLNFLFASLWLTAYIVVAIYDWRAGLFGIVFPSLALALLAGCQSYLDHAGLDDKQYSMAYSRASPFMSIIFFGANYHLEHHLYPKIPVYNLRKVHKILLDSGIYAKSNKALMSGFFEAFKTLAMPSNPFANVK